MKKRWVLLFSALLVSLLLCACKAEDQGSETSDNEICTISVVTEYASDATHGEISDSAVYNSLLIVRTGYQLEHRDVKIEIQMLPPGGSEREIALQNLRTEIMSGKGPDLFLLPAGKVRGTFSTKTFRTEAEDPLFEDVEQAMRNRLFYDLAEFYDNDSDLKTEELQPDIMDAGVYDGCRYVLPIAWNMPLIAVDLEAAKKLGMDESAFTSSIYGLWDAVLATGNEDLISQAIKVPAKEICFFPQVFDYETGSTNLTEEALTEYYTRMAGVIGVQDRYDASGHGFMELSTYVNGNGYTPFSAECPFSMVDLDKAAHVLTIDSYLEDVKMEILPLRATDGSSVAEVSYWGAVNANSAHPKEAYGFLREFLGEAVQFQKKYGSDILNYSDKDCAWPVRVKGSVEAKCGRAMGVASVTQFSDEGEDVPARKAKLAELRFTDSDLPVLFEPIDEVRFATPLTAEMLFANSSYPKTEEKIKETAQELATLAQYHIAES